jgi:hypothetical protein
MAAAGGIPKVTWECLIDSKIRAEHEGWPGAGLNFANQHLPSMVLDGALRQQSIRPNGENKKLIGDSEA